MQKVLVFSKIKSDRLLAAKIKSNHCSPTRHAQELAHQNIKQLVKTEWDYYLNSAYSNQTFSMVAYKGKSVIHIYCFGIQNNSLDLAQEIVTEFSEGGY